ncbi:MAG: glycosyltransferase family 2 protein [Candidatus Omnitrophica bacterium]|nr:glycosyltransferase family 2 protein [Candidatus Omnitrophota bacterium]
MSSSESNRRSLNAVVLIPAYQAQAMIGSLVGQAAAQGLPVIVVDDASSDQTSQRAEESGARVIRRQVNGGKGRALREGLEHALKAGYDWILTMDADGQHLPSEIPRFLEAAAQGSADLILGNRMENPKGMPLDRRLTNWLMSRILSSVAGQRFPDTQCGFRLIGRRVLEQVDLDRDRFEIESELLVKSAWAGARIVSIPVSSVYDRNTSFIRPGRDTLRFFRFLFGLWKSRR